MKIKKLRSHLKQAGFECLPRRGKGSHSVWKHPVCSVAVVQSGKDCQDAKPYQIKAVDSALQQIDCRRQSAISEKCRINVVDCS